MIHTGPLDGPGHWLALGFVLFGRDPIEEEFVARERGLAEIGRVDLNSIEEEFVALERGLVEIGPVVAWESLAVQLDPAALPLLVIDLAAFGALASAVVIHLSGLW